MIKDKELAKALRGMDEGEMILAGQLLKGISEEEIAWIIIEKVQQADQVRVTLHAYWNNVFVVSKVLRINPDNSIQWGGNQSMKFTDRELYLIRVAFLIGALFACACTLALYPGAMC